MGDEVRRTGTFAVIEPQVVEPTAVAAQPIDVQFWAPVTFTVLLTELLTAGRALELRSFRALHKKAAEQTAQQLQRYGGLVIDEAEGRSTGRLRVGVSTDVRCGGDLVHHHVYVSPMAMTLHDGRMRPVDLPNLRNVLDRSVWGSYLRELRALTEQAGIVWERPRPGAAYEIVEPALLVDGSPRAPGPCCATDGVADRIVLPSSETEGRRRRDQKIVEDERDRTGITYGTSTHPD